ncbi:MAG TPA: hypothetical protein PKD19_04150 [Candidatus Saccharibacteria bacterium]|jgi:hypothetical protein|nr:hypothetical protein [Candidatus Saccharibacteria bacterium]HMR38667.1 hypothetical protein [Candidatus Saccharibacteria bacterium]
MHIVGLLGWWYTGGLKTALTRVFDRLANLFDYFSIDILLRTLFAPFRQISAGKVRGPIGVQLRAFVDRLISRIIGAIVRSMIIVIGIVAILFAVLLGVLYVVVWLAAPALPVVGLSLMAVGWIPWHL